MNPHLIDRYSSPPDNYTGSSWLDGACQRDIGQVPAHLRAAFRMLTAGDREPLVDLGVHIDEYNPATGAEDNIWRSPATNMQVSGLNVLQVARVLGPEVLEAEAAFLRAEAGGDPVVLAAVAEAGELSARLLAAETDATADRMAAAADRAALRGIEAERDAAVADAALAREHLKVALEAKGTDDEQIRALTAELTARDDQAVALPLRVAELEGTLADARESFIAEREKWGGWEERALSAEAALADRQRHDADVASTEVLALKDRVRELEAALDAATAPRAGRRDRATSGGR